MTLRAGKMTILPLLPINLTNLTLFFLLLLSAFFFSRRRLRPSSSSSVAGAFDLIRSTRLTVDSWESVCTGIRNDLDFPDPDVTVAAVSILAAIPSYHLGKLISDCNKEISNCFDSHSDNLRFSITETFGCILARDDLVTLCENNMNLLDRVSIWWTRIAQNMLDRSNSVSKVAFESEDDDDTEGVSGCSLGCYVVILMDESEEMNRKPQKRLKEMNGMREN